MPVFQHCALVQVVPDVVEILDELVVGVGRLKLLAHLGQRSRLQHIDHEHRVVSRQRPSALCDEVRVGDAVLVGCVDKGVDAVVNILLD